MPKLSVSITDEHWFLVKKEMEELGNVGVSKAIQSLVEKGSPYEFKVEVKVEFKRKEDHGHSS